MSNEKAKFKYKLTLLKYWGILCLKNFRRLSLTVYNKLEDYRKKWLKYMRIGSFLFLFIYSGIVREFRETQLKKKTAENVENNKFEMKDKIELNNEDKEEDEKNDMDKDNKINLPEDNFPIVRESLPEKQEMQKQNEIIENKEDEN